MAACVSCGKEIPAGKFFCDECYVKMRGKRGALKEVPRTPAAIPRDETRPTGISNETETAVEPVEPAGIVPEKKASGTLTPASSKKVVSIKPVAEKAVKEKADKKKFTVTITFSERTYAAFARMKRKKADEGGTIGVGGRAATISPAQPATRARGKSPHGRPGLKAVKSVSNPAVENRGGLMRLVGYRERTRDRGDVIAAAMASIAVLMITVLSFTSWARISWSEGEPAILQTVEVKGIDLGTMTYICIAIAVLAYLYMVATWLFKGPFTRVDYGVVLIIAGIVFIPVFYTTIASNARILSVALEQAGRAGGAVPRQFERQTLWPAYAMVLMGAALAFSGLIRLSERKGGTGAGDR